ncbi:MAG TPA: ATP-binding protein [Flavobacterium sp.]|nr:ATP-binding protein [Flavobacterium sp.]
MEIIENFQKDIDDIQQIPIVKNILDVVCQTTGMGFAAIARVTEDRWITCSSRDDLGFGLKPGDELQIKTTICDEIRQSKKAVVIDHVDKDPQFSKHHTPELYGFQSYISVPIIRKDGSFFGTLCSIDPKPHILNIPAVIGMYNLFAELIAFHLDAIDRLNNSESTLLTERESQKAFTEALEKQVNDRTMELKQSQAFLQSVLNSTHYGIASYQAIRNDKNNIVDFLITYSNAEVPNNFGMTPEDVIGKTCSEVYPGIFENGVFEKMVHAMKTGNREKYEIFVKHNHDFFWLDAAVEKVGDFVTITSKNITAEKNAALLLEEINAELARNNKELESFNYIASHDLQEPLRKIQLFYSRIVEKDKDSLSETSLAHFDSIYNAAERMQKLIQALLSYSTANTTGLVFEKTDLNKLLEDVKSDLEDVIVAKNATIESEVLPKLSVIPFQFQQLLANLISNGIKYSKKDVAPIIKITAETVEEGKGKNYLKINIADNGIGFEQQYEHKIFELFQRLHGKAEFVGTGIGLAICKKIIDNHKGFIKVKGEPGIGSVFSIYIPLKK